jgi:adenine-specific DNA-methyltransferase
MLKHLNYLKIHLIIFLITGNSLRFIGNKERLVDWIYSTIKDNNIDGKVFFDFFSGTSSVGKFFKEKNYKIVSSDLLYFSYVLQRAYLTNNDIPQFTNLISKINIRSSLLVADNYELIIEYLNNIQLVEGFIYNNYTPSSTKHLKQPRMYFTDDNAKKIDAIRIKIEEWKKKNLINENEYFILLACLIESVPFFSNILGVFAAFKKDWDKRALKPFLLKPIKIFQDNKDHFVFNKSSLELLENYKYDIIYLDPPYNQRQYAPNYHILETIAKYDNPEIKGVTGMRNYDNQKSNFCNKIKALNDLELICRSNNYKYILLSYNCEGIMPQNDILKIMQKYGSVKIEEYDYLRFKSNNNGESKHKKYIKEQLYILTKN